MGINIPKILAKNFKKYGKPIGWKSATLTKLTPGTRGGTVTAGTNPTSVIYPCTARIADFTSTVVPGALIQQGDRDVAILGATLPKGIAPATDDKVTITDGTGVSAVYTIVVKGVRDVSGIGAVYDCQVRK